MDNYFTNKNKMKELRDALRIITENPVYYVIREYEHKIIQQLMDRDASLAISHPHYERMKAYLQGQINGLRMLFEARNQILKLHKGDNHDSTGNDPDHAEIRDELKGFRIKI